LLDTPTVGFPQKNPAPTLTVSARMVVLKKKATMQWIAVVLRMTLEATFTLKTPLPPPKRPTEELQLLQTPPERWARQL
jgi:hypothetical protein